MDGAFGEMIRKAGFAPPRVATRAMSTAEMTKPRRTHGMQRIDTPSNRRRLPRHIDRSEYRGNKMFKPVYLWLASAFAIAFLGCSANSANKSGLDSGGNGTANNGSGGRSSGGRGSGGNGNTGGGIMIVHCGNASLQPDETCDDGNRVSGDGCSGDCQLEGNADCPIPGQPCTPHPVCGDGFVTGIDGCDDTNTNPGDGCSADCTTVEPGWQCRIPGKACTPLCGDGVLVGTEQCDDGNATSMDGCSSTCVVEPGSSCTPPMPGVPSMCTKS